MTVKLQDRRPISSSVMAVDSLRELAATAIRMEEESASRFADLATKMRGAGRPDVAEVFDSLAKEEYGHAEAATQWLRDATPTSQARSVAPALHADGTPDSDEPPGLPASLREAYRSFVIAARNEERAFVFWSGVAANATLPQVRATAERAAHDELEHVKILRRERRRAFSQDWRHKVTAEELHDLSALELEVCKGLEERARMDENREEYRQLALEARVLSLDLASDPLQEFAPTGPPPPRRLPALCEWLVDYYVEAGESLPTCSARERALALAGMAIKRLAIVRGPMRTGDLNA